jgi:hypothetical protein
MTPFEEALYFSTGTIAFLFLLLFFLYVFVIWKNNLRKTPAQKLTEKLSDLKRKLEIQKTNKQSSNKAKSQKKINKIVKLLFKALEIEMENVILRNYTDRELLVYWTNGSYGASSNFDTSFHAKLGRLVDACTKEEREIIFSNIEHGLRSQNYEVRIDGNYLFVKI